MGHPPPAAAWSLTVDDGHTICRCLEIDGINAGLSLDIRGVDSQLQVAELGKMVVGLFAEQLLSGNFNIQAFAKETRAGDGVGVAQDGVGAIAIVVLIVRTDTAQTQALTERGGGNGNEFDGRISEFHRGMSFLMKRIERCM